MFSFFFFDSPSYLPSQFLQTRTQPYSRECRLSSGSCYQSDGFRYTFGLFIFSNTSFPHPSAGTAVMVSAAEPGTQVGHKNIRVTTSPPRGPVVVRNCTRRWIFYCIYITQWIAAVVYVIKTHPVQLLLKRLLNYLEKEIKKTQLYSQVFRKVFDRILKYYGLSLKRYARRAVIA